MVSRVLLLTLFLSACAPSSKTVDTNSQSGEIKIENNEFSPEEVSYQWNYPSDYRVNPLDRAYISGRELAENGSYAGPWLEGKEAQELPVGAPNIAVGKQIADQLSQRYGPQALMRLQPLPSDSVFAYYLKLKSVVQRSGFSFDGKVMTQDNIWDLTLFLYSQILPNYKEPVDASLRPGEKQNGNQLFTANCAMCHGPLGDSRGHSGKNLQPMPANFHEMRRIFNRSAEQLTNAIKEGIYGSAMPMWKDKLSETEIQHIVSYVLSFSYIDEVTK